MSNIDRKTMILEKLRQEGLRITSQRKLLIDVILENECSSCKEIYFQAKKVDKSVGIATVYRIIKTLEDLELIDRKNIYNIAYENLTDSQESHAVFLGQDKKTALKLDQAAWFEMLSEELKKQGLINNNGNFTIVIKENNASDVKENSVERCYSCQYNTCTL